MRVVTRTRAATATRRPLRVKLNPAMRKQATSRKLQRSSQANRPVGNPNRAPGTNPLRARHVRSALRKREPPTAPGNHQYPLQHNPSPSRLLTRRPICASTVPPIPRSSPAAPRKSKGMSRRLPTTATKRLDRRAVAVAAAAVVAVASPMTLQPAQRTTASSNLRSISTRKSPSPTSAKRRGHGLRRRLQFRLMLLRLSQQNW